MKVPVTATAVSEIIQRKADNPKDFTIEKLLKLWKAEATDSSAQHNIGRVLGVFRRNYAPLHMTIHITSSYKTIPIAEPTLRAIWNDLTPDDRDVLDLMAYGAERRRALNMLPLENVHLVEGSNVAILDVPARLSKTGIAHPAIIPKDLAERLLDKASTNGYTVLVPNYGTIWRRITKLAINSHKVRLTSHYLRKRFETLAERIPSNEMNPNHWVILMGSKPTLGHMPEIYSLLTDRELITEYETYLMPRLALSGETFKPKPSELDELRRDNAELKDQLLKLTKLLTDKLTSP